MEKTFKDLANTMRVLAEGLDMAAGQFNYL